jgi:hypothetical protein
LLAVPQGARPGKAGERWWLEEAAVVVTVSVGVERLGGVFGCVVRCVFGCVFGCV